MRCAMELLSIQAKVVQEAKEEALRKERERMERLKQDTLKECMELGKIIESNAEKGFKPEVCFLYNEVEQCTMYTCNNEYADRRTSHRFRREFDLELAKEWFAQYCFEIKQVDKVSKYWRYGSGCFAIPVYTMKIIPMPQC